MDNGFEFRERAEEIISHSSSVFQVRLPPSLKLQQLPLMVTAQGIHAASKLKGLDCLHEQSSERGIHRTTHADVVPGP